MVKMCILDDAPRMVLLVEDVLTLLKVRFDTYENPSTFLDMLDVKGTTFEESYKLLIVGCHSSTPHLWHTVVQRIGKTCPHLPILIVSTDPDFDTRFKQTDNQNVVVLKGPFRIRELCSAIRIYR